VSATAGELTGTDERADDAVLEAPAVLRLIWADPQHMAEHIAMWSLARFGPRADASVEKLRAREPLPDREELERRVVERQTLVAMTEGAFVGGPFIVLVPFAFCASLLAQAQMVYELAAVAGRDPNDRMRAAELLVLLGAYPSTDAAAAVLADMPSHPRDREGKRLPAGTRIDTVRRMAYLLEILGTGDDTRGRLRVALGWTGVGVLCLVGLVLPLVWVPYMAYSMRRSTLRMGVRAQAYFGGGSGEDAGVTVRQRPAVGLGGTVAFMRTTVFVALPLLAALLALLTGFSVGGGHAVGAGIVLIAVSALMTLGWVGYRWWRHRRRAG
jgi:hypothetical protein